MRALFLMCSTWLFVCTSHAAEITPVDNFELDRYLGKWYEIARLDNRFERHLTDATAYYSMRKNGGVKVTNRGYSTKKKKWKEAIGKAHFVNDKNEGHLKVSFFWPFYGDYLIFDLDHKHYQYAFVGGPSTKYLWFLSRTPEVSEELKQHFLAQAQDLGFSTETLIWVTHTRSEQALNSVYSPP